MKEEVKVGDIVRLRLDGTLMVVTLVTRTVRGVTMASCLPMRDPELTADPMGIPVDDLDRVQAPIIVLD